MRLISDMYPGVQIFELGSQLIVCWFIRNAYEIM